MGRVKFKVEKENQSALSRQLLINEKHLERFRKKAGEFRNRCRQANFSYKELDRTWSCFEDYS